jgi:hypothetical protein
MPYISVPVFSTAASDRYKNSPKNCGFSVDFFGICEQETTNINIKTKMDFFMI